LGNDWLNIRKAILEKVAQMNKTVWSNADVELRAKIGNIWEEAVRSALRILETQ
jgi:hypothetical protein